MCTLHCEKKLNYGWGMFILKNLPFNLELKLGCTVILYFIFAFNFLLPQALGSEEINVITSLQLQAMSSACSPLLYVSPCKLSYNLA